MKWHNHSYRRKILIALYLPVILAGVLILAQQGYAQPVSSVAGQVSPIHPAFVLLDANQQKVVESGLPISTIQTCGQCHDTAFITSHSFHSDMGLNAYTQAGQVENGRPWDASNGPFGKWNPLTYRYLSTDGEERFDLGTADWIRTVGLRHAGGGPAETSRSGKPLLQTEPGSADTTVLAEDGSTQTWDWQESGTVEMNCFLCHTPKPDESAREQALRTGKFSWANTATLIASGVVQQEGENYAYNAEAFTENGELKKEYLFIQDPTNDNCALCHGLVHTSKEPLTLSGCTLDNWQSATTGQVIAGQRISQSGMNIADKAKLTHSFDIHAERGLKCTECHFSLNNPAYYESNSESRPSHLTFDPRRLEIGEYLLKPDHNFARGQSAQTTLAPELKGTMRRCESCHNAEASHSWLPYAKQHFEEVACETCHVPQMPAPAISAVDWTVLTEDGQAVQACRGVEDNTGGLEDLVTGFQPTWLSRKNIDGGTPLAPYNLITAWYWVYDSSNGPRPVRLQDLKAAWFEGETYASEVMKLFDSNRDGQLDQTELRLDTPKKQALIAERLRALGLKNPHIEGEVQPYSINHNVVAGEWAIRDCRICHSDASRLAQSTRLAEYAPGDVLPAFVKDANTAFDGSVTLQGSAVVYQPDISRQGRYIFGHSRVGWIDWFGGLFFVAVLAGVAGHGTLRFIAAARLRRHSTVTKKVYMYAVYERFWHWLQTFTIVLLLFTGLIIHRPDMFGIFSFRYVVTVHNVMAAILVINAFLSLFYHLVSGEIRQFIPRPYGFFDQAIVQAKFYLQGIFRGDPHPFEKVPEKKMNPLQQATYFGILNILLPLQILTGALMWGVQQWPQVSESFGGLPFLAPFHSLVAWLFGAFIVGHVYLTTTGHEPLAGIKAMIMGWEEVEEAVPPTEEVSDHDNHTTSENETI
ncbi:MAG: cytochrome b/b6 domain-containing protein [Chloroflexota bacterium]